MAKPEASAAVFRMIADLADGAAVDEETVLVSAYEEGLLDSFRIVQLIAGLEADLGVAFGDDDLTEANFHRVRDVIRLVEARQP